mmetsp:Transcript_27576/g.77984  ORF Transcript_27576/g.77984 Transcript_27576/m.77984 type:complete len:310 (-) Transcript_27576:1468-2397(-)
MDRIRAVRAHRKGSAFSEPRCTQPTRRCCGRAAAVLRVPWPPQRLSLYLFTHGGKHTQASAGAMQKGPKEVVRLSEATSADRRFEERYVPERSSSAGQLVGHAHLEPSNAGSNESAVSWPIFLARAAWALRNVAWCCWALVRHCSMLSARCSFRFSRCSASCFTLCSSSLSCSRAASSLWFSSSVLCRAALCCAARSCTPSWLRFASAFRASISPCSRAFSSSLLLVMRACSFSCSTANSRAAACSSASFSVSTVFKASCKRNTSLANAVFSAPSWSSCRCSNSLVSRASARSRRRLSRSAARLRKWAI